MADKLVVNPFVSHSISVEGNFHLISPKIKEGLQKLIILKSESDYLYRLFLDLSTVRFDFLDIENDLNNEERELLLKYGVLVEKDKIPQKPLFACQLDEIEEFSLNNNSNLIVNPTLRFEPLNLGNFNDFAQGNNLLPFQPSVWIKTQISEIEIGYWLNEEQAKVVSLFRGGEKPPGKIEKKLLSQLVKAEILIATDSLEKNKNKYLQQIQQAQKDFKKNKYVVLKSLLPAFQMKAMRNYYREYVKNGFMPFSDNQVKGRYYQHNEPLAKFLHGNLTKLMSLVAGEEVKPSYVYAASYEEDAVLTPHTDRKQCEFSFSFQIDYQPEPENQISPWGLFVVEPNDQFKVKYPIEFPASTEAEDKNTAVYLASGDALAYKGCDLIHYRYALPKGHKSTSLFFHYVPIDFKGNLS